MKAYKLFNIALAASLLIGFASCTEKAPEYQAAADVTTSQVFFAAGQNTSFNLKGNDGSISIPIYRVDQTGDLSVPVTFSASDPAFKGPSTVTFSTGVGSSAYIITFDPAALEESKDYTMNITISGETSEYGNSSIALTASIPASWTKFGTGTLTEAWWGETETNKDILYRDYTDRIRLCKIENCWGAESGAGYPVQDYVWYWDTVTNYCYVPSQWMGYEPSSGRVHVSDAADFYIPYQGWEADIPYLSDYYFEWAPRWQESKGFNVPKYDGNGGFYLGDWFYLVDAAGKPTGSGYQFGGDQDVWIGDGFVRITDYNDDKHFGASSALYDGISESYFFSEDGMETPLQFEQSLRYDAEAVEAEEETTTYYLADYFAEGHALAFTGPTEIVDGAELSDVDNEQPTGIYVFGNEVYVSVKKGAIALAEGDEFPVFNLTIKAYAKDADGNVTFDFGTVDEVFNAYAYGKDGYTLDDVYGGYLEDYLGVWEMYSTDAFDGVEYVADVTISDAGVDADGVQWVDIRNLSGYDGLFNDLVKATFSDYVLFVNAQNLDAEYSGAPIILNLFDPDSGKIYNSTANSVLGGICSDGALAFVNRYNGVNLSGFAYDAPDLGGQLAIVYNVYGFGPAAASATKRTGHLMLDNANLGTASNSANSIKSVKMYKKGTASAVKAAAPRNFSLQPVSRSEKHLVEMAAPSVSR